MKKLNKIVSTVATLLCASTIAFGGNETRIGTTGGEQLLIPIGARSIATSGAFMSSLSGLESVYYNPAGLDKFGKSEAMVNVMNWIADIDVSYFGISGNMGDLGTVAFSVKSMNVGDISVTTVDNPEGTGATFSPGFLVAGLSYGKQLTDRVSGGATMKVIHESIMDLSATGFAVDFGAQYQFQNNLSLGVVLKNIGTNMRFSGGDLEQKAPVDGAAPGGDEGVYEAVTEKFGLPSTFEVGLAYSRPMGENNALNIATTFVNSNEAENIINMGAEYNLNNLLFVRAGYNMHAEESEVRNDSQIFGLTYGAGMNYEYSGIAFTFDYAYMDVETFDAGHVFTFKFAIGGN
jgi:hypothetical protein